MLKKGVIPTVFQGFPSRLQKDTKTRKARAKREVLVETVVRPAVEARLDATINTDAANNCSNDATSMEEDENSVNSKEISHRTSKETAATVQESI